MASVKKKLLFEHPLNERTRMWLRLEYLFSLVLERSKGNTLWDSRAALMGLLEVLDFLGRNDCKKLMIKELESRIERLNIWRHSEGVDAGRLDEIVDKLSALASNLMQRERPLGHELHEHYMITKVRQRAGIPGGTCSFDIPAYHFWLQKNPKERQRDLLDWLQPLAVFREALELNLYLIRNNSVTSSVIAPEGLFQSNMASSNGFHIIRIGLSEDLAIYPEVSGGAHRFTIRFYEYYNVASRPIQTEQDVDFDLCCCLA